MKDRFKRLKQILNTDIFSKEIWSNLGFRSVVTALVVALLTAGIATYVGVRFFGVEKEVLQLQGELNAKEAAMKYNDCLLTRLNIATMVGRAVDAAIIAGEDNRSIKQYLTEHSDYIETLDSTSTGLYGWINGEYLDGAGWVPDPGYVPTERPWYKEALKNGKKITFVDPYIDAQTNTYMMTVSELLSDGVSVIAMDISIEPLQQIVEQINVVNEGTHAFVLDDSGGIVAHSDLSLIGKNIREDTVNFGSEVAQRIFEEGQMQFNLKTKNVNYSVYIDELQGGWYSVSMIDADIWYRPIQRSVFIFSMILIVIVLFLVFVFLHMKAKNRMLQNLHTRIAREEKRGKELQKLSETDRMTGLYDRVSAERRINELLGFRIGGMFLEIDIDKFKSINDNFGHQAGDKAILAVADALRSTFRSSEITTRMGGDEFGAFVPGIADRDVAEAIVRKLFDRIDAIDIPELQGNKVSISVGAVLCDGEQGATFRDLYAASDDAMYVSKKTVGNCLTFST